MKALLNTLITLAVALGIVYLIALKCEIAHAKPVVKVVVQKEIMSIRELQTFLKNTGIKRYDPGKIDGKLGAKDKGTMKAWDNYICDRHYRESTYE